MADIRVVWNADMMLGDWRLAGQLLDTDRELVTAVAVALFTDRTADAEDEIPDGSGDRRGWWADAEAREIHGGWPIGSRLWLIAREKQTDATRRRADEYIREAMQPFIDIGAVSGFDLEVAWFAPERLGAVVTLKRETGSIAVRFETLWDEIMRGTDAVA